MEVCALWMLLITIMTVFHYASTILTLTCECTNKNGKHCQTFTGQNIHSHTPVTLLGMHWKRFN